MHPFTGIFTPHDQKNIALYYDRPDIVRGICGHKTIRVRPTAVLKNAMPDTANDGIPAIHFKLNTLNEHGMWPVCAIQSQRMFT